MPGDDFVLRPDLADGLVGYVGRLYRASGRCNGSFDSDVGYIDARCGRVLYIEDLVDWKRRVKYKRFSDEMRKIACGCLAIVED